jgi:hypothetical protein
VRPLKGRKVYVSVHEAQQIAEAIDVYGGRLVETLKGYAPVSRDQFSRRLKALRGKFALIGGVK